MADASNSNSNDIKQLRTVFLGTNVIFWILAIFMISILYSINGELQDMKQQLKMIVQMAGSPNLEGVEIVDPEDEEEVIYRFRRIQYDDEMMYDEEGNLIDPEMMGDEGMMRAPEGDEEPSPETEE